MVGSPTWIRKQRISTTRLEGLIAPHRFRTSGKFLGLDERPWPTLGGPPAEALLMLRKAPIKVGCVAGVDPALGITKPEDEEWHQDGGGWLPDLDSNQEHRG